jgi:preprotein translocase subunit SecG
MPVFLIIIHVVVCIALILIVLLQTGKGADMGAAFGGGGSNTLFGATGASTFLGKLTTVAAVVFMLTSLTLAYMSTNRQASSILQDHPAATKPIAPANATPAGTKATGQKANAPQTTTGDKGTPQKTE